MAQFDFVGRKANICCTASVPDEFLPVPEPDDLCWVELGFDGSVVESGYILIYIFKFNEFKTSAVLLI